MKSFSTSFTNELGNKANKKYSVKRSTPRRQTLDFISQFARVYHTETSLGSGLSGFILN